MRVNRSHLIAVSTVFMLSACSSSDIGDYSADPEKSYLTTKKYFAAGKASYGSYSDQEISQLSVGRIDLGKKLFYDERLSRYGDLSCASCHNPNSAFTQNNRSVPQGTGSQPGGRNAPSLYDVALNSSFNRDGSAASITDQANGPLTNPLEMANVSMDDVVARVSQLNDYKRFFDYAYEGDISGYAISNALASYQYTLLTGPNNFDKWIKSERKRGLNKRELAGFNLFTGKAGCIACHKISGESYLFTDNQFHDIGYVGTKPEALKETDLGRFNVTGNPDDKFAFKTPGLRNVALTAPYMHDGGIDTLQNVIEFFNISQSLGLTADEKGDLKAFLAALTSKKRPK